MYILSVACIALFCMAVMGLVRFHKLKRIMPTTDDEGVVHYPEKIYDRHTTGGLVLVSLAILTKVTYFGLIYFNLRNVSTITFKYIVTMQLVSIMCLCGAMAVEINLWLKY
jgi:uncharacterized membrane protein